MNINNSTENLSFSVHLEVRTIIFRLNEDSLQILLVPVQQIPDSDIHWNVPGNDVCDSSPLEKISSNLIHYHTGVQETYQEQLYTYENLNIHNNCKIISIVYYSLIPYCQSIQDENRKENAKWFPVQSLPPIFHNYDIVIPYALSRLRYKLEYSAVGFELLPKDFSLSQLQKTYEIILDEKLDKRNFRRKILEANIIEPTPHLKTGEGRPARLYRYKADAVAEIKTRRLFP